MTKRKRPKDRQYNDQKKKTKGQTIQWPKSKDQRTSNDPQHTTQKTTNPSWALEFILGLSWGSCCSVTVFVFLSSVSFHLLLLNTPSASSSFVLYITTIVECKEECTRYIWLIDCWLVKSRGKYFIHIQDENKFSNIIKKNIQKWGRDIQRQGNNFWLHLKKFGKMNKDEN